VGGYRFTTLSGFPKNWDQLQASGPGSATDGAPWVWYQHTVFGGAFLELHKDASLCAIHGAIGGQAYVGAADCRSYRLGAFLRILTLFDLGWYDKGNISQSQFDFLAGSDGVNADGSVMLQAGVAVLLTQGASVYATGVFGVFGVTRPRGDTLVTQSQLVSGGLTIGLRQWL
jgi:hypothetical protein